MAISCYFNQNFIWTCSKCQYTPSQQSAIMNICEHRSPLSFWCVLYRRYCHSLLLFISTDPASSQAVRDIISLNFKVTKKSPLSPFLYDLWFGMGFCLIFFTLSLPFNFHNKQAKAWQRQCHFLLQICNIEWARVIRKCCSL